MSLRVKSYKSCLIVANVHVVTYFLLHFLLLTFLILDELEQSFGKLYINCCLTDRFINGMFVRNNAIYSVVSSSGG